MFVINTPFSTSVPATSNFDFLDLRLENRGKSSNTFIISHTDNLSFKKNAVYTLCISSAVYQSG